MATFQMTTKEKDREPYVETFTYNDVIDQATAEKKAVDMIKDYNHVEVERYGKKARTREILEVKFIGGDTLKHDYRKMNSFTQSDSYGMKDIWECRTCGCRGLRRGVGPIVRTGKWRPKKYENCLGREHNDER
jgi:hypothetical protein